MMRTGSRATALLLTLALAAAASAATPEPARGALAMVVSAHPLATEAGLSVLRRGGNAVDAAAAVAFAISVVEPQSAGIGGGGFALVYLRRQDSVRALDFRERAPLGAHRDLYLDDRGEVIADASITGHRAAAVPGTVAGLAELVGRHGALKLKDVLAPAISLAEEGFAVSPGLEAATRYRLSDLRANSGARDVFLRGGEAVPAGDLLVQRDLAGTLKQIARRGPQAFYAGKVARAFAADMAEQGGLITAADLKSYRPVWRAPVRGRYRGLRIFSMPLPSSGGLLLLEILGILERGDTARRPYRDVQTLHLLIEAERRAYADRASALGDPAFLRKPADRLIAPARLDRLYRSIDPQRRTPSSELGAGEARAEGGSTSHLCVVDAAGNAVSLTFTVNTPFGAAVVVPGTGVLLNNEMDDFSMKPGVPNAYGLVGSDANAVAPAKIPLSSMTPTLVFDGDDLRLAVGSPGGSTIITTVLQVLLNVVDYDMDISQAIAAPRLHHQWLPDEVMVEFYGLEPETRRALITRGHSLVDRGTWGNAMGIQILPDGTRLGAADPRGEGLAQGY